MAITEVYYFSDAALPRSVTVVLWRAIPMIILIFIGMLVVTSSAYSQESWPVIKMPHTVSSFNIAEQITSNGMPMRIQGFVSKVKPEQLLDWFRESLGQPIVENTLGNKKILGRAQGGYYLTVQIEAFQGGSRGIVAVSDLKKAMTANKQATQMASNRWLNRLPSGSKMVSQLSSNDRGNASGQWVVVNSHSEILNREALVNMMRDDGYELKRETTQQDKNTTQLPTQLRGNKVLIFAGKGKEAVATIQRIGSGETSVVLNTVTQMEKFK